MKKTLSALFTAMIAFSSCFALEMPYFSGYAGFLGAVDQDKNFDAEAFFSGQTDFSGKLLIRTEFYVDAKGLDLLEHADDLNAVFNIQELSATHKIVSLNSSHFLSAFLGEYEPIGSDIFLQRQFGIKPITSQLTQSYHGLNGASLYPAHRLGGSYIAHIGQDLVTGLYVYKSEDAVKDNRSLDFDLRLATVKPHVSFDFAGGVSFVYEDKTYDKDANQKDVFLLIEYLSLHAGMNLLLGSQSSSGLFLQAGIANVFLEPNGIINDDTWQDSLYLLLEPRLAFPLANLNIAFFALPFESQDSMMYIFYPEKWKKKTSTGAYKYETDRSSVGVNINIYNDNIILGSTALTLGTHITFAAAGCNVVSFFPNLISFDFTQQVIVSPYASLPILGGTIHTSLSVNVLEFPAGENPFTFRLGFRSQL